jgi:hypothetical protein
MYVQIVLIVFFGCLVTCIEASPQRDTGLQLQRALQSAVEANRNQEHALALQHVNGAFRTLSFADWDSLNQTSLADLRWNLHMVGAMSSKVRRFFVLVTEFLKKPILQALNITEDALEHLISASVINVNATKSNPFTYFALAEVFHDQGKGNGIAVMQHLVHGLASRVSHDLYWKLLAEAFGAFGMW